MRNGAVVLFVLLIFNVPVANCQYNYFVGNDAYQLSTTVKGFGSISFPSVMWNASKIAGSPNSRFRPFYSINFGFNWKQWRFAENQALVRDDNGNIVVVGNVPENGEDYTPGFFSYTKSKFAIGVIRLRPEFGFTTNGKKFSFGTGPLIEFAVAAKHKRKFLSAAQKQKSIQKGVDYYNLNRFQLGWGVSMGTYHFGVFSYYMITPMFKEHEGPDVHAAEIGLYWRILVENYQILRAGGANAVRY